MIKKIRNNEKGFTLAELLIVVAIIAVLTAIAIPVFTRQMEKSREATDLANVRSAYAELMSEYLTNPPESGRTLSATVQATQTKDNWDSKGGGETTTIGTDISVSFDGSAGGSVTVPCVKKGGTYIITVNSEGKCTVTAGGEGD